MKIRLIAILMAVVVLAAGRGEDRYEALPAEYDGTMMTYEFSKDEIVEVPDSLTPFHLEYVARHGARYLSSSKKVEALRLSLEEEAAKRNLTDQGRKFLSLLDSVSESSNGKWGMLTEVGIEEERDLSERVSADFPGIFGEGRVVAIATYVPRVVESMYTFLYPLCVHSEELEVSSSEGGQYNALLRFFDCDNSYGRWLKHGDWEEPLEEFVKKTMPTAPAKRLLMSPPDDDKLRKLSAEMYGVLQSLRAASFGAPTTEWMSETEYRKCWECSNMEHYLKRSVSTLSQLPAWGSAPLLLNIIGDADESVENTWSPKANLRFGHAETLLPLVALMDLPGCRYSSGNLDEVADKWHDYDISPLGANLRIVLARSESGRVYAAVWLNGRCVIDWEPWSTLRGRWLNNAMVSREGYLM